MAQARKGAVRRTRTAGCNFTTNGAGGRKQVAGLVTGVDDQIACLVAGGGNEIAGTILESGHQIARSIAGLAKRAAHRIGAE